MRRLRTPGRPTPPVAVLATLTTLAALATLVAAGCTGSTVGPDNGCPWTLEDACGDWRLVQISGGLDGSGMAIIGEPWLALRADSSFAFHHDTVDVDGRYRIFRYDGPGNLWGDSIWVVEFEFSVLTGPTVVRQRVRVPSRDSLGLDDMYADGYQQDFVRIAAGS